MTGQVAYNPFHGPRLAIAVLLICIMAAFARGADTKEDRDAREARDRNARAALALAGAGHKPTAAVPLATAPAPRPKLPTTYPQGYAKATTDVQPLVVFVGCDLWPVKGAVVAQATEFAGVTAPAVVVGYPVADRLRIHVTLRGEAVTPARVQASANAAADKIDAPPAKDMPAPVPVDWMLRANPVAGSVIAMEADKGDKADAKKGLCICGDACKCADKCPNCPTTKLATTPRDALVRVTCGNGSGSGTVIWSDGDKSVVLTAAHVLTRGQQPTVRGEGKWHKASVLASDDAADLAALLVNVSLPPVCVASGEPDRDAEVLMYGVTSLWSKGKIAGGTNLNGREVYLLGYDSDSGDSGGGVFVKGELIGVHCGKVSDTPGGTGKPYCTAAKPIRAFVARVLKRDGDKVTLVKEPKEPVAAPATQPKAETPVQVVTPVPSGFTITSGGCANGSCGTVQSSGWRFRRR